MFPPSLVYLRFKGLFLLIVSVCQVFREDDIKVLAKLSLSPKDVDLLLHSSESSNDVPLVVPTFRTSSMRYFYDCIDS